MSRINRIQRLRRLWYVWKALGEIRPPLKHLERRSLQSRREFFSCERSHRKKFCRHQAVEDWREKDSSIEGVNDNRLTDGSRKVVTLTRPNKTPAL